MKSEHIFRAFHFLFSVRSIIYVQILCLSWFTQLNSIILKEINYENFLYCIPLPLLYIYQAINYSQHKWIRSKYNDAIMRGPFLFFYNTKSLTRIGFYVHSIFWRFWDPFDIRDFKGLVYLKPQTHIQPPLKNIWEYLSVRSCFFFGLFSSIVYPSS